MSFIGRAMLLCLALAILERIIVALAIALSIAVAYFLFFHTGNTVRILLFLLMMKHPGVALICFGVFVLVVWISSAKE